MLGEYGLTWPWESLHVEALALVRPPAQGPQHRNPRRSAHPLCGARQRTGGTRPTLGHRKARACASWRSAQTAPSGPRRAKPGERAYVSLGTGLNRRAPRPTDQPTSLTWTSDPLDTDLDLVGAGELILLAAATAADTAWIATLQDVGSDDKAVDVTAGWLRAGLYAVDQSSSRPGEPVLPCRDVRAGTDRRGGRLPDSVGGQRTTIHSRSPGPAGTGQRRPARGRASHHGLPARVRRDEQRQHRTLLLPAAPASPAALSTAAAGRQPTAPGRQSRRAGA